MKVRQKITLSKRLHRELKRAGLRSTMDPGPTHHKKQIHGVTFSTRHHIGYRHWLKRERVSIYRWQVLHSHSYADRTTRRVRMPHCGPRCRITNKLFDRPVSVSPGEVGKIHTWIRQQAKKGGRK